MDGIDLNISSKETNKVMSAIEAIQDELVGIQKSGKNPHFKNTYATLNNTIVHLKPHLRDKGLSVLQTITVIGGTSYLVCRITHHESGQWVQGFFDLSNKNKDPQQLGSSISYMRRYSYFTMFGLLAADDDAELAVGRIKDDGSVAVDTSPKLDATRYKKLLSTLNDLGYADIALPALFERVLGRKVGNKLNSIQLTEVESLEIWSYAKQNAKGVS